MDKIKINLLPREVLEKRKAEQRLALMLLGLVVVSALLMLVYGLNFMRIAQEQSELDIIKTENNRLQAEISKIADFENNKLVVEERAKLVNSAIAGKYSWAKFLNNISLIVPNEVWLTGIDMQKSGDLKFSGSALAGTASSGIGHKPVAKWLVHLSELEDIGDVWLSSSTKQEGGSDAQATATETQSTVIFQTTAKIKSLGVTIPTAPAPPATGGKT